ncbi:MAG: hypothetical protein F2832_02120 [Actinobacteria bacterium]|nr:hypothetical protein [Actinomycetota bacterium]
MDLAARLVRGASDQRLERTLGRPALLALILKLRLRRADPAAAGGFVGELGLDLARVTGPPLAWAITVDADGVRLRRRPAREPAVSVALSVADLLRIGTGVERADGLLLVGRLDLAGDWAVAMRLSSLIFG